MELQIGDKVTFQRKCVYSVGNYIPSEKTTIRTITEVHTKHVSPSGTTFWRVTLSDKQTRYIFLHTNEKGNLVGWAENHGGKESRWVVVQVNDTPLYMS